jgi:transcriptional regulator with XRE-family HTH domain
MDQATVAQKLGISRSYLSELETGKKQPTLDILDRYARVVRIPPSSILLLSESLADGHLPERVRLRAAKKILKILEWLTAREEPVDGETGDPSEPSNSTTGSSSLEALPE